MMSYNMLYFKINVETQIKNKLGNNLEKNEGKNNSHFTDKEKLVKRFPQVPFPR